MAFWAGAVMNRRQFLLGSTALVAAPVMPAVMAAEVIAGRPKPMIYGQFAEPQIGRRFAVRFTTVPGHPPFDITVYMDGVKVDLAGVQVTDGEVTNWYSAPETLRDTRIKVDLPDRYGTATAHFGRNGYEFSDDPRFEWTGEYSSAG